VAGLYDRDQNLLSKTTLGEAPALFQVATLCAFLIWLLEPLLISGNLGRDQMVGLWVLLFAGLVVGRLGARAVGRHLTEPECCLVIGDSVSAERLRSKFESHRTVSAKIVGRAPVFGRRSGEERTLDGAKPRAQAVPVVGDLVLLGRDYSEYLNDVIGRYAIDRVILASTSSDSDTILDTIRLVKALGVRISVLPRLFEVVGSSASFDEVGGVTLLGVRHFGLTTSSRMLKRGMDMLGAGLGLALCWPLMVAIAIAIKLDSRGPVLFRQRRIGRENLDFELIKFRTMVDGADTEKAVLEPLNEADGLFKIRDDPRITRVGRVLRKTSLDELPQLLNVLRGEMSLVGPRPLVPDDDRRVEGWHRRRLHVTPGMTGYWQVLGSARIPLHEMVKIDYLYAANWSLWTDLKILLQTIPFVLNRKGL
jgi:exopolysaccharide biosynthesis polyprenyl glycosylphosphotransferase